MRSILSILSLAATVLAASRTTSPTGCKVVSKTATSGQYKTVSSAVAALSSSSTTAQCIFIGAGTYSEQVYIPVLKSALTIYGYTADTTGYAGNKAIITGKLSQDDGLTDDETATLRAWTPNLKVYNINLVNTRGSGSQALALSAYGTQQGYYGVQFIGFQDTILAQTGVQVYAKCLIEGATDFIFGQNALAWFHAVDIRVLTASVGYITANGRASSTGTSYYVINKSTIAAASGSTVKDGAYYLGRPWGAYARVVFQSTSMTSVINAAGWSEWSTALPNTANTYFGEYANTGAGASGTRASFGRKLTSAVAVSTILGSSYTSWVDTTYLT